MLKSDKQDQCGANLRKCFIYMQRRTLWPNETHTLCWQSSRLGQCFLFIPINYFILTFGGVEDFWTNLSTSQH